MSSRFGKLAGFGALFGLGLLALYWLIAAALVFTHSAAFSDFRSYYAAAWVGTHHGWSHIYDQSLLGTVHVPGGYLPFASPPPTAWLAAPLTALPYGSAQLIWTIAIGLLTVAAAATASGDGGRRRIIGAGLVLATLPAVVTCTFGQSVAIGLAGLAAAGVLERRKHHLAAGAVLSLAFLKPQTVILLPLQLLLARRFRMLIGLSAAGLALAATIALSLGTAGIEHWLQQVQSAGQFGVERQWSLEAFLPPALAWAVRIAAIAAAAAVARFGKRPEDAIQAGVFGSMLISPYSSPADFVLVAYCVAQLLMARRSPAQTAIAGAAWIAVSTMTMAPGVMPVVEAVLLAVLCVESLRGRTHAVAPEPLPEHVDLPSLHL